MVQKKQKLTVKEAIIENPEAPKKKWVLKGKKEQEETKRYWYGLTDAAPMRKVQIGAATFLKTWVKRSGSQYNQKELWMQGYVGDLTPAQVEQINDWLAYTYFHVVNRVDAELTNEMVNLESDGKGLLSEIKYRTFNELGKAAPPVVEFPNDDDLPVLPFVYFVEVDPSVKYFPMGTPLPETLATLEELDAI